MRVEVEVAVTGISRSGEVPGVILEVVVAGVPNVASTKAKKLNIISRSKRHEVFSL